MGVGVGASAGVAGRVRERCGRGTPHPVASDAWLARAWGVGVGRLCGVVRRRVHFLKMTKEVGQMLASHFLKSDKEVAQI